MEGLFSIGPSLAKGRGTFLGCASYLRRVGLAQERVRWMFVEGVEGGEGVYYRFLKGR